MVIQWGFNGDFLGFDGMRFDFNGIQCDFLKSVFLGVFDTWMGIEWGIFE